MPPTPWQGVAFPWPQHPEWPADYEFASTPAPRASPPAYLLHEGSSDAVTYKYKGAYGGGKAHKVFFSVFRWVEGGRVCWVSRRERRGVGAGGGDSISRCPHLVARNAATPKLPRSHTPDNPPGHGVRLLQTSRRLGARPPRTARRAGHHSGQQAVGATAFPRHAGAAPRRRGVGVGRGGASILEHRYVSPSQARPTHAAQNTSHSTSTPCPVQS